MGRYRAHLAAAQAVSDHRPPLEAPRPGGKVVLDLTELSALARLFEDAGTRVEHTRLALRRLAADVEPARTRLPDQALGTLIANVLTALDAPTQLPLAAARLQRQGAYADRVRRPAERADGGDGRWSAADARRFVHAIGPAPGPYERAVKEALLSGVIVHAGRAGTRRDGCPTPAWPGCGTAGCRPAGSARSARGSG